MSDMEGLLSVSSLSSHTQHCLTDIKVSLSLLPFSVILLLLFLIFLILLILPIQIQLFLCGTTVQPKHKSRGSILPSKTGKFFTVLHSSSLLTSCHQMVYIYQREKCLQHFSIQATVLGNIPHYHNANIPQ